MDTLIYNEETSIQNSFINNTPDVQVWSVNLTLLDIYGCEATANTQLYILPQPGAYFTHSDLNGCAQGLEVQFENLSSPGVSSKWSFDDLRSGNANISYSRHPTHVFTGPGDYFVHLFVQNTYGCRAEYTRRLGCNQLMVYVPNAFTPDGNRLNEIFKPVIYGIHDIEFTVNNYYTFEIFNRWGDKVFETHDPDKGWNGDSPNDAYYSQADVYNWRINIEFPEGAQKWVGHVTLVR